MARDGDRVTAADIEALREAMADQREAIRTALAEELGGEPADYRADDLFAESNDHDEAVPDGGA